MESGPIPYQPQPLSLEPVNKDVKKYLPTHCRKNVLSPSLSLVPKELLPSPSSSFQTQPPYVEVRWGGGALEMVTEIGGDQLQGG